MTAITGAAGFSGQYDFEIIRGGEVIDKWTDKNLIPLEGLNHILNVLTQAGTAKIPAWYLAIGTGNYTVASTDTGANIVARAVETSLYAEATRVAVTLPASTAASLTNTAAKATFTANAGVTVTNAFVVSTSAKSDVAGVLLSSLKLATAKTLIAADQLVVTFTLSAASV